MKRDEFARNPAAATYDLIVLDVLRDGPGYGYRIRNRIEPANGRETVAK